MTTLPLRPNLENKYRSLWEFANARVRVEALPADLQVARSNHCNFRCVYCIDHRVGNTIPRSELEGEVWEALLALIPRAEVMAFHGISEFMVDPRFFEITECCGRAGVELSINTNGSVASPRHVAALVGYPARLTFNVSVDAATPETYRRVRGWDFRRLLENLETWVEALAARRQPTWLNLSFVVMRSTLAEVVPFLHLAHSFGVDGVTLYPLDENPYLDWRVPDPTGGTFDYRSEAVSRFPAEFNAEIERARRVAAELGLYASLPASAPDPGRSR